jgi:hypothetical protein
MDTFFKKWIYFAIVNGRCICLTELLHSGFWCWTFNLVGSDHGYLNASMIKINIAETTNYIRMISLLYQHSCPTFIIGILQTFHNPILSNYFETILYEQQSDEENFTVTNSITCACHKMIIIRLIQLRWWAGHKAFTEGMINAYI